jgi:membrane protease YdiL (CAAX protease family)
MTAVSTVSPPPLTAPPPPGLRRIIRRRPLLSFFVLANAASWLAWLPYVLSQNGLGVWGFHFPGGPAGSQLLGVLPGAYLGPIGSAFLVTAIADGRAGLRLWAGRLWRWRVSWKWYAGILLGVPAGMVVSTLAFSHGTAHLPSALALIALAPGLLMQMVTTGLAEEPGWRDFALPRLQRRIGPLRAALLLGVLWGVWHLPLFLTEWGGYPHAQWYRPIEFVVLCVVLNIVMAWVFNRTGESLPMAMLLHVSLNNFASIAWSEVFPGLGAETLQHSLLLAAAGGAAVLLVATRGRLGYRAAAARLE